MSRYDASFDESWDIDVSKDKGFPYTFPFQFDRTETREITPGTETWTSDVAKTGRYGVDV